MAVKLGPSESRPNGT